MNCFLGFVVLDTLSNNKTYHNVIKEILHYLHLHQTQVNIMETTHLLTINSLHNTNSFSLPKQGEYTHTCYHKISFSESLTEADMSYFRIVLECILIVKEHFPSKIQIQINTENQHLLCRLDAQFQKATKDLSRRYISHFRTLLLKSQQTTQEQIHDIFYILRNQNSNKLINTGLSILKKVPDDLYKNINQIEINTLQRLTEYQEYQKNSKIVIDRINQSSKRKIQALEQSRKSTMSTKTKYDQPTILNSFAFQLRESNNLQRLGFLIQKITSQIFRLDKENLNKIDKTIFHTINRVVQSNKIQDCEETLLFADSVIRYLIIKKQVNNWETLICLLNECTQFPTVVQGIIKTFQVFYQYYKERCDQNIMDKLQQVSRKLQTGANCQTQKQSFQKLRVKESCQTSRSTAFFKGRKSIKSMYGQ